MICSAQFRGAKQHHAPPFETTYDRKCCIFMLHLIFFFLNIRNYDMEAMDSDIMCDPAIETNAFTH